MNLKLAILSAALLAAGLANAQEKENQKPIKNDGPPRQQPAGPIDNSAGQLYKRPAKPDDGRLRSDPTSPRPQKHGVDKDGNPTVIRDEPRSSSGRTVQ